MLVTSDFLRPNRNRSVAEPLGTSAPPSKPAARRSSSRRTAAAATPPAETPPAETPPAETPPDAQPTRKRRAMSVEEKKAVSERMKGSNDEWTHPHDPDAKITKMKDGRTHLAHKAEHAVDLETGAVRRCHRPGRQCRRHDDDGRDAGDGGRAGGSGAAGGWGYRRGGRGQGYHSNETLVALADLGLRSYVSEPDLSRRRGSRAT